ncbi:unnamed protein product [Phytomonas sp. EM1]|nr:unnamed protein product [Phytomonas sp. EM1]|eukprot:CCW62915.1 unnamed protein product [Phytomonas sp. isolate EM1]
MNEKDLSSLAVLLSSEKLTQRLETASMLRQALSPENLLPAWRDPAQAAVLRGLLSEAQSVGNPDVLTIIGESLEKVLSDKTSGEEFINLDEELLVPNFVLNAIADDDLGLNTLFRRVFMALVELTFTESITKRIGEMLDRIYDSEKVLRLFDCDAAESEENSQVYRYLRTNTHLIDSLTSATIRAFDEDPLLLVNYLVVCGIISRHESLPDLLLHKIQESLDSPVEDLFTAFVCRFCSIALFHHEGNAQRLADPWVRRAVEISDRSSDEGTLDAVFDLMGSSCTTATGWNLLMNYLTSDRLLSRLCSSSKSQRLSALRLLNALLSSPYMDPGSISPCLLNEAWKLHTTYDEEVLQAAWQVSLSTVRHRILQDQMPFIYASFLCGARSEVSPGVRELQLQVARLLANCPNLPDPMKLSLVQFSRKGLYPPGSDGVADLRKD